MPKDEVNKAYELFRQGIKLVDIAKKLDKPPGTIRRWKSTYKWDGERSIKKSERSIKSKGAQPGNKNGKGGPVGNDKAKTHGLFERYLPVETMDIVNEVMNKSPIDLLWDQIMLAYAAIVRSQKIMHVEDRDDHNIIKSGYKIGKLTGEDFAVESAHAKQTNYLSSLSRVQSQLNNMIRQYDKMVREDPLATEMQKARIELMRAQTDKVTGLAEEIEDTEELDNEIFGD